MKTKPDTIIEYGLIFLIIFTPLAFGSVHIWAYTIVEVVVLLLLLTFLLARSSLIAHRSSSPAPSPLHGARSTEPRVAPCPLPPAPCSLPLALFLGLIIFQIVPLPATVVKHLSPNTYDLYQQTLGNSIEQGARSTEEGARSYEPRAKGTEPSVAPHSQPLASRPLSLYSQATKTEFLKFFVYVSVFFLIITTMTTLRQIRRLVLTIIFTGTGVAFLALCQMLSKSDKIYGFWQSQYKAGGYGGPFINANHLAGYLEMVIPLALGFLLSREKPGIMRAAKNWKQRLSLLESWLAKNVLLIFIIVLMSSALFLSVSRGGILSFVFSLGLFSLLLGLQKSQKGKREIILLISGLIFVFLLWMGVGPVVSKLATLANLRTASVERPQVWKDTLILARDFPLFGVGLGNFQTIYPKYKTITTPTLWEHAHNDYVEMLADTGWVGLLLFFGGIWFLLFTTIKKWKQRRDPFLAGITLGGFIGAVSLLCHCLVEFSLHIPANAFLLFVILGLITVAVNLKKRGEEEFSLLPVSALFLSPKIRTAVVMVTALMVVFLLTLVMKDYLGYRFFTNYQSLSKEQGARIKEEGNGLGVVVYSLKPTTQDLTPNTQHFTEVAPRPLLPAPCPLPPAPLRRAIFFDSGNAHYRYELGNYYAHKMSESWEQGAWNLQGEIWVFDAEKNIRFFGLKALQAYADAANLSPVNAWYHFYRGRTLSELKRFSDFSHHPIQLSGPRDAETEFARALMLDPNNKDIKKYINAVKPEG
ncbi:MAG TPA: O-antigen ligase family protein [Thermodesulfobacteriota bacterium]|nr:O-antigen ligase family protein [Thermodesulfobacteriota bacterium]